MNVRAIIYGTGILLVGAGEGLTDFCPYQEWWWVGKFSKKIGYACGAALLWRDKRNTTPMQAAQIAATVVPVVVASNPKTVDLTKL